MYVVFCWVFSVAFCQSAYFVILPLLSFRLLCHSEERGIQSALSYPLSSFKCPRGRPRPVVSMTKKFDGCAAFYFFQAHLGNARHHHPIRHVLSVRRSVVPPSLTLSVDTAHSARRRCRTEARLPPSGVRGLGILTENRRR